MRLVGYALVIISLLGVMLIGFSLKDTINKRLESINTFELCSKHKFPILETSPRQCRRPDGVVFTEKLTIISPETGN